MFLRDTERPGYFFYPDRHSGKIHDASYEFRASFLAISCIILHNFLPFLSVGTDGGIGICDYIYRIYDDI